MEQHKDIIKVIIDKLKNQPDLDYREGAWERFQQKTVSNDTKIHRIRRWASIAAAFLLVSGSGLYLLMNTDENSHENQIVKTETQSDVPHTTLSERSNNALVDTKGQATADALGGSNITENLVSALGTNARDSKPQLVSLDNITLQSNIAQIPALANIEPLTIPSVKATPMISNINKSIPNGSLNANNYVLATGSHQTGVTKIKEVENLNQSKLVRLSQKVELGLFVSPHGTSDKTHIGGGLVLAYNLTNKISLRTGASYNTYSVGQLKNPTAPASVEAVSVNDVMSSEIMSYNALSMGKNAASQTNVFLPNINAVSGIVQSVDIPLEVKYNVSKSLYATAGASYSAIVNQQREAQYIENMNSETFASGFPSNDTEMAKATQVVTKTVKSAENNVNTNSFNGFVNFSVGQKVKINNKVGLAIEPYVKLPVGQYRKADMNYTNGGIRIMTSF